MDETASKILLYIIGNYPPFLIAVILTIGFIIWAYYKGILRIGKSKMVEEKVADDKITEILLATGYIKSTLTQMDKRLDDIVDRVSSNSDELNNLNKEMRDQRKVCEESKKEIWKKIDLNSIQPDVKKNGKSHYDILVVDDDIAMCQLFKLILEERGHRVITATNYDSAVRHIDLYNFQYAFLDVVLENKNSGYDLWMRIYRLRRDTKLILMSGYSISDHPIPREMQQYITTSDLKCISKSNIENEIKKILK